jgi:hypothetical protein
MQVGCSRRDASTMPVSGKHCDRYRDSKRYDEWLETALAPEWCVGIARRF